MKPLRTADGRIAAHAARHHGYFTRTIALRSGLTDRQIYRRVQVGRWDRVAPGVFRMAGAPISSAQTAYGAVLAAGPNAAVAGLSSLALLNIGAAPLLPRITVPSTASSRTSNAIVRRSPLASVDRTMVGPIPCTTPARALLEAAADVDDERLAELVDDVICRGLATPGAVEAAMGRAPRGAGRQGAPRLRVALEPWLQGIEPDSPAEMRLIRRLRSWSLPEPVRQHEVQLASNRLARIDLAWPEQLVGLEYDGQRWHTPRRLDADLAREAELSRLGWWIGRVDRHDLAPSSTRVRDELIPRLLRTS